MNQVAWVVGGVKGLGVMVLKGLVADGYTVVLNYRKSRSEAIQLQQSLEEEGGETLLLEGDASNPVDVQRMVGSIYQAYQRLDILVVMAGPFIFEPTMLHDYSLSAWNEMISGNLSSVFYCAREVIPLMRKRKYGRIITFGFSEADKIPASPGYSAYSAAKTGVVSLTRSLAQEEVAYGITVNMICPGDIRDPYKESSIEHVRQIAGSEARPGSGEDIARVVRFLVHPDSDFITGATIPVTGGFLN